MAALSYVPRLGLPDLDGLLLLEVSKSPPDGVRTKVSPAAPFSVIEEP